MSNHIKSAANPRRSNPSSTSDKLALVTVLALLLSWTPLDFSESVSAQTERSPTHRRVEPRAKAWERMESSFESMPVKLGGGAINEKKRNHRADFGNIQAVSGRTHRSVHVPDGGDISDRDEKRSYYDPENILSHSLHALVGLDRYPNYLHRWAAYDYDIDSLERALESRLEQVRAQKRALRERRGSIARMICTAFEGSTIPSFECKAPTKNANVVENDVMISTGPDSTVTESGSDVLSSLPFPFHPPDSWDEVRDRMFHPDAVKAIFKSRFFSEGNGIVNKASAPSVLDVINGCATVHLDQFLLEDWIDQEMFDVFSFPLLSHEFCETLRNIVRTLASLGEEEQWMHLQLGRQPVNLDMIGLGWINDLIFHLVVRPLSRELFNHSQIKGELDWRTGFVAGYRKNASPKRALTRDHLVAHTDDSEVTLNICIGDNFKGGSLRFFSLRGSEDEGQFVDEFEPTTGTALIHAGRHLHDVTHLKSGDRYAFIIWARSWSGVRSRMCPCCWLTGRQGERCVCAPQWN